MPAEKLQHKFIEYGTVSLKAATDADQWTFTGTASTPAIDRQRDSMDPQGAKFTLPLPLLLQHDATQPIGQIVSASVSKAGITVAGKITEPTADMPPGMAGRLREAWQSIKSGLIRGLSIGFLPDEYAPNDAGGFDISTWEWLELSLVTIPANAAAGVASFKSVIPPAVRAVGGIPLRAQIIKLRS